MSATAAIEAQPIPAGVSYGLFMEAWQRHADTVRRFVEENRSKAVCEIGGGANPTLTLEYARERGIECTVLDISQDELDKAPPGYRKVAADICAADLPVAGPFDFMFSKMLAEHVRSGQAFHENVFKLLAPGGLAFHFFPTLYAPPFVVNRLLPEGISSLALRMFSPRDAYRHAKFPARYSWCRGPTGEQLARLEGIGYEIVSYRGFFGHDYYRRIPVIRSVAKGAAAHLCRHPWPALTTFAFVLLRKPGS